ncbi:LysR family transcriptional regulator [Shewanella violacea]|uniref:Transcriptional regulator, LysR family n=1 Tax=Shewanella violacea (strain JCM 10179 / CIP 106290 / LMG 19151 / DSS12) TaxID=637905 RepID=D4ZMJ7_SHEVD|nr:LysR family transcriptional regulator [Shewanella violacea]BAJ02896.1 transcriptional regulator, LysR family [Shewanella violacea DSS12]
MSMLTRLHYFNCVVETGSISKASRVFDIQPSSISRQLMALEKDLGIRLLNRNTRNIGLTEAGLTYYQYSQRIVSELDEAHRAVNELQKNPKGHLKVSMTVGFGESCVLPLISAFIRQYPEVNIELELTERVIDMVEENVDIAIRSGHLPDSNLIARKLTDNNFLICSSPQYITQHGQPLSANDLHEFDCIKYGYAGWREWLVMTSAPHAFKKLTISEGLTVNSVNGQKQLMLNDAGFALIPLWAVKEELKNGSLVQILAQDTFSPCAPLSSTYALYQKRELISPKIRVFLDFIRENLDRELEE